MTLIMSAATKRFVVLVSDRRITTFERGRPVHRDDLHTKSAFMAGRYIMGFAGLARLGPEKTRVEQWLVEDALGGYRGDEFFEVLAEQTGSAVQAMLRVLRKASLRSDGMIGTAAVVTVMPLAAVPVMSVGTFVSYPSEQELLAFPVPLSFSVPDEHNPSDGRQYQPAIWSQEEGVSAYGFRSLITNDSAQAEMMHGDVDLDAFDAAEGDLATSSQIFAAAVFQDFPRHPLPREDRK